MIIPKLTTPRLRLDNFELNDSKIVKQLINTKKVSSTTLRIGYPYSIADAKNWINTHQQAAQDKKEITWAIRLKSGQLIGAICLILDLPNKNAEIGYWLGVKYWKQGYCSEAAKEVIKFGFTTLKLNKIFASRLSHNPASGKVLEKCGMKKEGYLKEHMIKNGKFVDIVEYGILKKEFKLLK